MCKSSEKRRTPEYLIRECAGNRNQNCKNGLRLGAWFDPRHMKYPHTLLANKQLRRNERTRMREEMQSSPAGSRRKSQHDLNDARIKRCLNVRARKTTALSEQRVDNIDNNSFKKGMRCTAKNTRATGRTMSERRRGSPDSIA